MVRYFSLALLLCLFPGVVFAPPQPPAILGLLFVQLNVSDLQSAINFLGHDLKLIKLSSGCYVPTASCFYVNDFQQLELSSDLAAAPRDRIKTIGIQTKDAATLRDYLMSRGLQPGPLSKDERTQAFEISDPEGHQLVFESVGYILESILSQSAPPVSDKIIHAGIIVHDRAATEHFYKDILGFRPYWHGGMKEGEDNWVSMQVPEGTDWLEFMLNVPANASKHTLGVMNHVALGVPDIHAAREQLVKNGWKGTEEPKIGRDGKWQLNLYDPDDTRIEFMEFTPVQKPCCSEFTGPHPGPQPSKAPAKP